MSDADIQTIKEMIQVGRLLNLIQRLKDALGTEEDGDALVEVARNAHRAEQALAAAEQQS